MDNDFISRDERKESVKAKLRELIRSKVEPVAEENRVLREEIARLKEQLDEKGVAEGVYTHDDELSRRAGRIIIDAQAAAQKIIAEANKEAGEIIEKSRMQAEDLLKNVKMAEESISALKSKSDMAAIQLDTSLREVKALARRLSDKYGN